MNIIIKPTVSVEFFTITFPISHLEYYTYLVCCRFHVVYIQISKTTIHLLLRGHKRVILKAYDFLPNVRFYSDLKAVEKTLVFETMIQNAANGVSFVFLFVATSGYFILFLWSHGIIFLLNICYDKSWCSVIMYSFSRILNPFQFMKISHLNINYM